MDSSIFTGNRYETWKFEKLTLSGNDYIHDGWITNYIEFASILIDFDKPIIGSAKFRIKDGLVFDYLSDRIKIYYSISGYDIPLGVYILVNPVQHFQKTDINRDALAYDLLKVLEDDKITTSYTADEGDVITDEIENIVDGVGNWTEYNIEESTETFVSDKVYEVGTSKLTIINSMLNMINYYPLWVSGNGVYRAIPWTATKNIAWDFQDNSSSIYEPDVFRDIDYTNSYNKVIVIASQLDGNANLYKSWTMEDEGIGSHPFSYTNIGRYVTKVFYSEASSQSKVDDYAKRKIRDMLEISESINYQHAYISSRESDGLPFQGDHYKFKNTELDIHETYKIIRQSWNLEVGESVYSKIRRVTTFEV